MAALEEACAPARNVRHAEKRRLASTCLLADRVARAALDEWRRMAASSQVPGQTCVAAVVAAFGPSCTCLSLGVGTKVARRSAVAREPDLVVRDCHAEVLAVRSFRRYCYSSLEAGGCAVFDAAGGARFRLREGVALYLYCSSAPCGNATIRKWAKSTREVFRPELGDGPPPEAHGPFHVTAPGQVALLGKRRPDDDRSGDDGDGGGGDGTAPTGCCAVDGDGDGLRPHCCSDKVARWAALGLEGALLSRFVARVPLAGVVVGRKFSFEHARRAFCCRIPRCLDAHPALMGTSVPCDEGVFEDGRGATFASGRCYAWARGDDGPEPLDGPSGKAAGGAPSLVSRRRLLDRYLALSPEGDEALSYEAHKRRADDARRRARDDALRFGPRAPFAAWLCSRPPLA